MLPWIEQHITAKKAAAILGICFVVAFLFVVGGNTSAQELDLGTNVVAGEDSFASTIALANTDPRIIVAKIIRAVLGLIGIILTSIVIYAGFLWMTSAGNEEKISTAKSMLTNAVIGLVIILSAFSITQFVINSLLNSLTGGSTTVDGGQGRRPGTVSFTGSGSLGRIIVDHYPDRNAVGVPRNTSIVITFAEPIDPSTVIENTNNTFVKDAEGNDTDVPIYGDCVTPADGTIDLATDCDQLITATTTDAIKISRTDANVDTDVDGGLVKAAAFTTYDAEGNTYQFVFRPLEMLGAPGEDISYNVVVQSAIQKTNGDSIFINESADIYPWEFQTSGDIDLSPPTVESTYPENGDSVAKNTIVQINFSEPMDPTSVQGTHGLASTFSHIIFGTTTVVGEWRVTNGYKTVEFIPDEECGANSCGEIMYCLPVMQDGQVLVRTADLLGIPEQPFSSVLFSGVMDMATNALDGDKDGEVDDKPAFGGSGDKGIDPGETDPDNYSWNFDVRDEIDRSAPYIRQVSPGLDQEGVSADAPVEIMFNRSMFMRTLSGVGVEEYREGTVDYEDFWKTFRSEINSDGELITTIRHRNFGPDEEDYYYFVSIPSTVKSLNQNCLYPGRGPDGVKGTSPVCKVTFDDQGNPTTVSASCAEVTYSPDTDTACVNPTDHAATGLQPDIATCVDALKGVSKNTP